MNKLLVVFSAFLLTLGVASCGKDNKLHDTKGVVTEVNGSRFGDSIYSVKVLADGDTLLFTVWDSEFTNGIMTVGDSVTVYYTKGNKDTLVSRVMYVHPKPSKVIDKDTINKSKPLLTR